jgi:glycogen synthase
MNILMIGPGEPSLLNSGLGVVAEHLAAELAKMHQLSIMEPNEAAAIGQTHSSVKKGIFSESQVQQSSVRIKITEQLPFYFYGIESADVSDYEQLNREVKEALVHFTEEVVKQAPPQFDIIYVHDWTGIEAAIALKNKYKKPFVLHMHSLDIDRSVREEKTWVYELEQRGMQEASHIIAVSNYMAQRIQSAYGIAESKITVAYPAVSIPEHVSKKKKFPEELVLFVGRLSGQKGPDHFMQIAETIIEKRPHTRFVIAGSGDMMKNLIESGAKSEMHDKFHFTGYLNDKKLAELYQMTDVYCMPSVSEPLGLSALEAASYGLPVVLSKQSGAAELLPHAKTVDFRDTEGFAEAIIELLKMGSELKMKIHENRKELEKRSWQQAGMEVSNILTKQLS